MKRMLLAMAVVVGLAGAAWAQTSRPSTLEVQAAYAFNNSNYAVALPLLQKLAIKYADDPERLGRVEEQIRFCQRNLAKAPATQPAQARKPIVKPAEGQVLEIEIKGLGNFDYDTEKGGNVPADVQALGGVKIRTHGFMVPLDQADNITEFALVPSLFACCFGQPPQIQHTIIVHCPKGKAVRYFADELVVEGSLKVDEKKEDGYIVSLFEMDAGSVRPAEK